MVTTIYEMSEASGVIKRKASYTLPPREALRNYIMQVINGDPNWWTYPEFIKGMREVEGRWYWDDLLNGKVIAAYTF